MHNKIKNGILSYAKAYARLQNLQNIFPEILPKGDQKTGVIGEYYSFLYLISLFGESRLRYGGHSEKGWDIEIIGKTPIRIQVKTVSEFSKNRIISPLHSGWNKLFILYLNKKFYPEGFWIITDKKFLDGRDKLSGLRCCLPSKPSTGSSCIPFGKNRVEEIYAAIDSACYMQNE